MRKISILLPLFLTIYMFSFGQTAKIKQAEKLYENYSYSKSIAKYEKITDKTTKIKRHLANSYYHIQQYDKSEKYYSEIVNSNDRTVNDIYNYSFLLSMNKKYKESSKWMAEYNKLKPTDNRGILATKNKNFFVDLQKDKGIFVTTSLEMNTDDDDFGVAYYKKDKVVFCSSRTPVKLIKRKWNWNNLPFLDLYTAEIDSTNNELINIKSFGSKFNTKFHEGRVAFNKAGDFMVLTRNNYDKKSSDGVTKLQMYYTSFSNQKWGKLKPMPFNNKEYSVAHPSLSKTGDTLYFVSDMPGGIGGIDIYKSIKTNGTWGSPINLGKKINTEGNETFPFIHENGYLFFSSDGWPGLGGLDVFVTKLNGDNIGKIENLRFPVNSSKDDFAFVLDSKMEAGYFSSNREEGKGNDDIYKFILLKPIFKEKLIQGVAKDTANNLLSEVEISLYDNNEIIKTITTSKEGNFEFIAEADKIYKIKGTKAEYIDIEKDVNTKTDDYIIPANLILETMPEFWLFCTVTDKNTGKAIDSVNISLINNISNENEQFTPLTPGVFSKQLNNKLNDSISYTLNLKKEGYLSKEITYKNVLNRGGQFKISEQMTPISTETTTEVPDVTTTPNLSFELNPIYFDFNKSNIRKDAKVELDKIVKIMNEYKTIKIELSSHTDYRGSDAFNESLSQKRIYSSISYIKRKIPNNNRIQGKGYGENQPLIITQKIHDKYTFLPVGQTLNETFINSLPKNQQEIAHQLNRRTEFKVVSE